MGNLEEAVERIKSLECPTGDIEKSVALILEDYEIANLDEIKVSRNKPEDKDGMQAYKAEIQGIGNRITVLSKSGLDDYVSKVFDAYIS